MILRLPEPPSANRWWRKFRNRMVLSPEARAAAAPAASATNQEEEHNETWADA